MSVIANRYSKRARRNPEQRKQCAVMAAQIGVKRAATRFGVSEASIRRWMAENGITVNGAANSSMPLANGDSAVSSVAATVGSMEATLEDKLEAAYLEAGEAVLEVGDGYQHAIKPKTKEERAERDRLHKERIETWVEAFDAWVEVRKVVCKECKHNWSDPKLACIGKPGKPSDSGDYCKACHKRLFRY